MAEADAQLRTVLKDLRDAPDVLVEVVLLQAKQIRQFKTHVDRWKGFYSRISPLSPLRNFDSQDRRGGIDDHSGQFDGGRLTGNMIPPFVEQDPKETSGVVNGVEAECRKAYTSYRHTLSSISFPNLSFPCEFRTRSRLFS